MDRLRLCVSLFLFFLVACDPPAIHAPITTPTTPTSTATSTPTPEPTATPTEIPTPTPDPWGDPAAVIAKAIDAETREVVSESKYNQIEKTWKWQVENSLEEFKQSEEYKKGLQDYLDALDLEAENVEIGEEVKVIDDQEYRFLVAVPDQTKLTEVQQKYVDLYSPVPIFMYEQDKNTVEFEWHDQPPLRFFADIVGLKIGNNAEEFGGKTKEMKLRHFNCLIVAWPFRWKDFEPEKGKISQNRFRNAESIIFSALEKNMEIMGQPLFFWAEYPDWLKDGNFSQQELEEFMREHVRTTMEPWKGKIKYWTVVNEFHPLEWHEDYLQSRLGNKVLQIAFEEARKTDPNVMLIYNDNNNHWSQGPNFDRNIEMIKRLKEQGLVDAVGMHMHLNKNEYHKIPSTEEFAEALQAFSELGVEVYVTEFDVNLSNIEGEDRFLFQGQVFYDMLSTYTNTALKAGKGDMFSIWSFYDNESWLETSLGMENADGLLFDNSGKPKPSFYTLLQVLYSSAFPNP